MKFIKPELGQEVSAIDSLSRHFDHRSRVTWVPWGDRPAFKATPVTGLYVGSRTKQNGYTQHDYDYGPEWVRTGSVEVWLIVVSDRKNPIFVLPQHCTFTRRKI